MKDARKTGLEKELTLKVSLLAVAREARFSRSGIRSYFGFENRILMNLPGHRPHRGVVAGFTARPIDRRASRLPEGDLEQSLPIPGPREQSFGLYCTIHV
jgi:hypothetical protein